MLLHPDLMSYYTVNLAKHLKHCLSVNYSTARFKLITHCSGFIMLLHPDLMSYYTVNLAKHLKHCLSVNYSTARFKLDHSCALSREQYHIYVECVVRNSRLRLI